MRLHWSTTLSSTYLTIIVGVGSFKLASELIGNTVTILSLFVTLLFISLGGISVHLVCRGSTK